MAGIGFELRRMIDQRDGFVAKVRAYTCAGLISSGPWVMTILTLTLLSFAGPYLSGESDYSLFRALVTYAFAFSLILQGIGQMAITRHVADLLYSEQYERVLPAFVASFVGAGVVHIVFGVAFCVWAGFPVALSSVFVTLLSVIGMTWFSLIWLSVAREYDEVLRAYIYGTLISLIGMVLFGVREGPLGILGAYTAGQSFILFLLVKTILRGMEKGGARDFTVFRALGRFPRLVLVGFFYNAGIWADKMIFWFKDGTGPHPYVQYHPLYDTCSFLAYLTVVPALAVNLIRLETSFYEKYRAYYGAILNGTPLSVIEDKKRRMFENLKESTIRLIRVQGALTVLVILFARYILDFLEMPEISIRIFRLTCLGAFFHVLLLITVLMQLYFDLRTQAMSTSLVFLLLNGGLAWWSVEYGIETYGIGYAVAALLSLLLGYILLHQSLDRINYLTFTGQPIGDDPPDAPAPTPEAMEAKEKEDAKDDAEQDAKDGEEAPDESVELPVPEMPPFEEPGTGSEELVPAVATEAEISEDPFDGEGEELLTAHSESVKPISWTPPIDTWNTKGNTMGNTGGSDAGDTPGNTLDAEDQTLTLGEGDVTFLANAQEETDSAVGFDFAQPDQTPEQPPTQPPDPSPEPDSDETDTLTAMSLDEMVDMEDASSPEVEPVGLGPPEHEGGRIEVRPDKLIIYPRHREPGKSGGSGRDEETSTSTTTPDDETAAD